MGKINLKRCQRLRDWFCPLFLKILVQSQAERYCMAPLLCKTRNHHCLISKNVSVDGG